MIYFFSYHLRLHFKERTKLNAQNLAKFLFFIIIVSLGTYFFYPRDLSEAQEIAYIKSYGVTLGLTIGGIAIGITLGFILAFIKFLDIKVLNFVIDEYIDILRGTPVILQLLIFSVVIFATWSDNFYVAVIDRKSVV